MAIVLGARQTLSRTNLRPRPPPSRRPARGEDYGPHDVVGYVARVPGRPPGHATQSDPAGMMARTTPLSLPQVIGAAEKGTTTSAVAADLVNRDPRGSSASSQPLAHSREVTGGRLYAILRTKGVAVGGDAGVPPPSALAVTRTEDMPALSALAAGAGPSPPTATSRYRSSSVRLQAPFLPNRQRSPWAG